MQYGNIVLPALRGFVLCCRWRVHLDVDSSIAAFLEAAEATDTIVPQQQCDVDTQLRTRDPSTGRMVVQFESPQAAALALDAAAEVAAAAGSLSPVDALVAAAGVARQQQEQQRQQSGGSAFAGGWLVDLLHAAVHRAIVSLQ
jgi:hypothetical protein